MKNPSEKEGCVLWTRGPYKQLSVVNTIHIQMRVTKFGTETSTRPPPGLPVCLKKKKKEEEKRSAFCEPDTCLEKRYLVNSGGGWHRARQLGVETQPQTRARRIIRRLHSVLHYEK